MDSEQNKRIIESEASEEEYGFEQTLRPQSLNEYIGQKIIKENLDIAIQAAQMRKESLEHVLLIGPPGLGKTTLANIIAKETNNNIYTTSGPAIERTGDLASIITNLSEGDILFIDEIHRLNRSIEEVLYAAMEDYALDLVLGKGPGARTVRLDLPRFTLIGATTKPGMLTAPLRDRFGFIFRLNYYEQDEIEEILQRSAKIMQIEIESTGVEIIAQRSRRTPRIANRLLKRVRDYVQVKGDGKIDNNLAGQALDSLAVDGMGLDEGDRIILETIIEKFDGGPVGLQAIAAACMEDEGTVADIHEPYLMQIGFIQRTPKGRIITHKAKKHLGITDQNTLL